MNKKCPVCKKLFFANRKNKIFCNRTCKERNRRKKYLIHRKEYCEQCGFIPKHICQLDVDHINGIHEDNKINNLQTLCSNCHRLKTMIQRTNHDEEISSTN